jgi:hypothetical protein
MRDRTYRLGHDHRDTGWSTREDDEFSWINIAGRGMRSMGGIRPLGFHHL